MPGKSGRPAIVVTTKFALWVGNETDAEMTVGPCSLFGFNTGDFEERVVTGWCVCRSFRVDSDRGDVVGLLSSNLLKHVSRTVKGNTGFQEPYEGPSS